MKRFTLLFAIFLFVGWANHGLNKTVSFTIEVEPIGHGPWMIYKSVKVKPGESFNLEFPTDFQSR